MIAAIWADTLSRRLLILSFVNSAPVAITSTLFLFYVDSVLNLPNLSGPFLLVFFLSAALSAPVWGKLGTVWGEKRVLALGMTLSIVTFFWAVFLGPGQVLSFALISALSGAALGGRYGSAARAVRPAAGRSGHGVAKRGLRAVVLCVQAVSGGCGGGAVARPSGGRIFHHGVQRPGGADTAFYALCRAALRAQTSILGPFMAPSHRKGLIP